MENQWNTSLYDREHGFVAEYGRSLLEILAARRGETILDLGCGTGHLTAEIANKEAKVIGIDASGEMIGTARRNYPDLCFEVADARDFIVEEPVDAVFSNATLHWIVEPDRAIDRVYRALKPEGRFVAEFGGKGNVGSIVDAVKEILEKKGYSLAFPWYFPSIGEYAGRLEARGFEVMGARLFDRPTPLENGKEGLKNWLRMFANGWLSPLSIEERERVMEEVEIILKPKLFRGDGWSADYRRLQIIARREDREVS
ncbi:class I SAM-dependent methyltransferase [Pannus brasiliensis CCIBt3594]|uniref:Class I SAM-dependent methyltransferase n=1 Tax=Pannus brasiliensis CCIBt3594 TaxID=1427578 RepID=A0AAW9QXV0_9CHRO